jgi:hypothetical protein
VTETPGPEEPGFTPWRWLLLAWLVYRLVRRWLRQRRARLAASFQQRS